VHENIVGFGLDSKAKVRGTDARFRPDRTDFRLDGIEITMPLVGRGNLTNALAAAAACLCLGMDIRSIADAIKTMRTVHMRAEPVRVGPVTVINDCYNANPASMTNALELLKIMAMPGQRRVFVCGQMAELGSHSEHFHRQLGLEVREAGIDLLVAVGRPAAIVAQVVSEAPTTTQVAYASDAGEACKILCQLVKAGDIVLIKGSRIAGLEAVMEALEQRFAVTKT
jgi:UDP-N-acetylmuramoyl-tripeptide--D-alanyl-D-alanine ligase